MESEEKNSQNRPAVSVSDPLVSICTTFFDAERYIHRLLESCLNQTYKNIEVIVVDDASTDKSERIVREYAVRDPRIKYFKNAERVGLAESELIMFKLAKGDFSMMVGADDWLARDYTENGVHAFLKYPDAAGVIPDLTTLFEYGDNGVFTFESRTHFPIGTRKTEWFIKSMYKPTHLYISAYALVRSKDFVSALDYYVKNYYRNPSESIPEELRGFFRKAFGMDAMTFPEILTRYKYFVFDSSLNYIKISHSQNQYFNLKRDSLAEVFKDAYYYLLIYTNIYKSKWPNFYRGMKVFVGAQALSAAFIHFFRNNMQAAFLNFREGKEFIDSFFNEFSFFEVVITVMRSAPMTINRCLSFFKSALIKKYGHAVVESSVFTQDNFLDSEKRFKVS